jgi:hypothetical protein
MVGDSGAVQTVYHFLLLRKLTTVECVAAEIKKKHPDFRCNSLRTYEMCDKID